MADADDFKELVLAEFKQMGLEIAKFTRGELVTSGAWYYNEQASDSVAENLGTAVEQIADGVSRLTEKDSPEWEYFIETYEDVGEDVARQYRGFSRPRFERAVRSFGRAWGKLGIGEDLGNHAAFQFVHMHITYRTQQGLLQVIESSYQDDAELKKHVESAVVYSNHVRSFLIDFARAAGDVPPDAVDVFANLYAEGQAIKNWGASVEDMAILSNPALIPRGPIAESIAAYEAGIAAIEAQIIAEMRRMQVDLPQQITERQTGQQELDPGSNLFDSVRRIYSMLATERDHRARRRIEESTIPRREADLAEAQQMLDYLKRLQRDVDTIEN
ncbi:hypothetical protein [Roseinatronobacter monicus]|uniref:Uncharacterized protein n=1 Tax=Roseinatronobacter monicus TaxID=393481 RepID=A0A543K5P5_9RHOB|nr:hypothetical protein [Roseinatronobacter monicus]TQM90397.1 hypothetical protein BD293_3776 [Roseinatronobacter monicus]